MKILIFSILGIFVLILVIGLIKSTIEVNSSIDEIIKDLEDRNR